MTPQETAARIVDMLDRRGRFMSLRRRIGTTNTFTEVAVRGLSANYPPEELVGGIVQGDRKVIISNAEIDAASWPGPPRRGDILVIDGISTTVQAPDNRVLLSTTVGHVLQVRG
jgi:hypothetical protein